MERDTIEMDVVCVGAGVASLSTALRLARRAKEAGDKRPSILVLEKGKAVGGHVLSGAVLDPEPLAGLLTETERKDMPVESTVASETFYRLSAGGGLKVPWLPPPMHSKGFPILSLTAFTQYLAQLCEAAGIEIYPGFPATELLREGGRIAGVRIGDKGLDKHGKPKSHFEPGPDIKARAVVLGEGACGFLTESLITQQGLARHPDSQTFAVGIKELVETPPHPERAGAIVHTFGYPHDAATYGGGFVYCLNETHVAIGLVTALDYRNPTLNPHDAFRRFKAHPLIQPYVAGGKVVGYGAKILPEGGCHAVPTLATDGALIVGDAAGLLDSLRLKGIHIAIQSGLAAGDTLFDAWQKNDFSLQTLQAYPRRFEAMSGWKQMRRVKNVRACFSYGQLPGMAGVGMSVFTNGILPPGRMKLTPDWSHLRPVARVTPCPPLPKNTAADPATQLDLLSDVFYSGTKHEEDQPCHLKILDPERCRKECIPTYDAPCTRFCPAQVYTLSDDRTGIRIDASNCLHCKTCRIKDPLQNIQWTPPEGNGGPEYKGM